MTESELVFTCPKCGSHNMTGNLLRIPYGQTMEILLKLTKRMNNKMNVMLKIMEVVSNLKKIGCKFETNKGDDELLREAAFVIGALQKRFPQEQEEDNCRLSIDQRRAITNAYMSAINNKDIEAGLEQMIDVVNEILSEVKEK